MSETIIFEDNIDCIVVDPPRGGLSKNIIDNINKSAVDRLVYVSCNPVSQKRDIDLLATSGFKVIKHEAVDMFINTEHVETVALLQRV